MHRFGFSIICVCDFGFVAGSNSGKPVLFMLLSYEAIVSCVRKKEKQSRIFPGLNVLPDPGI